MTDKKEVKVADTAVTNAVKTVKKLADTLTTLEKGTPPATTDNPAKRRDPILQGRMKKAIEGAEKLGATVTPIEPEKGPVVIVGGVRISPIKTGIKPSGGSGDIYVVDGMEFWLPHHVVYNQHTRRSRSDEPWEDSSTFQGPEMSLFAFTYDGSTFYLLMDEHSTFTRNDDAYYNRSKGGHLIMLNSSSLNDQFIGGATLVNVESENNVLNRSSIVNNSASVGRERGWGASREFQLGDKRQKYEKVRLRKTDVIDSDLSGGRYIDCNFTKISLVGGGTAENLVSGSSLSESRIYGSKITIENVRGETLNIHADGEILIKGISHLVNQDWNFPSIYITNRFAFTEIDYVTRADRGIRLIRLNKKEVGLNLLYWKSSTKLAIDANRQVIEETLRGELEKDKEKKDTPPPLNGPFGYIPAFPPSPFSPPKPGESIRNFVMQYLVDQVFSRLGMIQMLDEVEETAKELHGDKSDSLYNLYE